MAPCLRRPILHGNGKQQSPPHAATFAIIASMSPGQTSPAATAIVCACATEERQCCPSFRLLRCLEDHSKLFPEVVLVGVGQLAPHITTEVDWESLFSSAKQLSDPKRSRTKVRNYERLVIAKHRLDRIYLHQEHVLREHMQRNGTKDGWDEKEDREDLSSYLEIEKEQCLKMNPHNTEIFGGNDDEEE